MSLQSHPMKFALSVVLASLFLCSSASLCQKLPDPPEYRNKKLRLTLALPPGWNVKEKDHSIDNKDVVLISADDSANPKRRLLLGWHDETGSPAAPFVTAYQLMRTIDPAEFGGEPLSEKIETLFVGGLEFARADFKVKDGFMSILVANHDGNVYKLTLTSDQPELEHLAGTVLQGFSIDPDWKASDAPPLLANASTRVRLDKELVQSTLVKKPEPIYPPIARAQHVEGFVALHGIVGADGKVKYLWYRFGNPMFLSEAVDAVKKWSYRPYVVNGVPVEFETDINVNFQLRR